MPNTRHPISVTSGLFASSILAISAHAVRAQMCDVGESLRQTSPAPEATLYGSAVALDENRAVIVGRTTSDKPRAFVFEFDGTSWTLQATLNPAGGAAATQFATAAAIQGEFLAFSKAQAKVVYLYKLDNGQWVQQANITPPDAPAGAQFGSALAMSGDLLVVGAEFDNSGFVASGSAYVFRFDGSTWNFEQKIVPADPQDNHRFGSSVAVHADTIVVGTEPVPAATSEAYVFHHDGVAWTQSQKLTPPDPTGGDLFGASVAVSGSHLAVGAPKHKVGNILPGAAYVYVAGKTGFAFQQQLIMPDDSYDSSSNKSNNFGKTLALHDDLLLVGAPTDHLCYDQPPYSSCNANQGSALLYRFDGSTWNLDHRMRPKYLNFEYPTQGEQVASALALSGTHALLGAEKASFSDLQFGGNHSGIALFFDLVPLDCDGNGIPDACDPDCNVNLFSDVCDLASTSSDCNANSVPDECESPLNYSPNGGFQFASWGAGTGAIDLLWLNHFSVTPGREYISHIAIAWQPVCINHLPVKLIVYEDPNNDGNPGDAVMIQSVDAFSINDHPNAATPDESLKYSLYSIPPTFVGNAGDHFFIGAFATVPDGYYPALSWLQGGAGQSWSLAAAPGTIVIDKLDANQSAPFNHTHTWAMGALSLDCNGNGVCDQSDISSGTSLDVNANGIPDDCEGSCIADLAPLKGGNGVVDVDDLLAVINSWGDCEPKQPCPADIAPSGGTGVGNSVVDVDDLLMLINNWGECL